MFPQVDALGFPPGGTIARNPARLVATYFANEGQFAQTYTKNGYWS
jgi:hypothetical protein